MNKYTEECNFLLWMYLLNMIFSSSATILRFFSVSVWIALVSETEKHEASAVKLYNFVHQIQIFLTKGVR